MPNKVYKPAPMMMNACDSDDKYIAAICPACGKYPGKNGWQVCQYCDRWVEAHGQWSKKRHWWQL